MPRHFLLYDRFAEWWPLISPPDRYVDLAIQIARLVTRYMQGRGRSLLELGGGGGCLASCMKKRFRVTIVDVSSRMLEVSKALNPDCTHVTGDMRNIRLGREYSVVLAEDSIAYMASEEDLRCAVRTAFVHCARGAVVILAPEHTVETFEPTTYGDRAEANGEYFGYLRQTWRCGQDRYRSRFTFMVNEEDRHRVYTEWHTFGLFPRSVWLGTMSEAGFRSALEQLRDPCATSGVRDVFVGVRA